MVVAIANQKGGAGKSTTTAAMAAWLTAKKYKVLVIDLDPQGNSTDCSAAEIAANAPTAFHVLTGDANIADAIATSPIGDIIPAAIQLTRMDTVLIDTGKEYILKETLAPIKKKYDYILIDTPPSGGVLTANALTAATGVIIPTAADKFNLTGFRQIRGTIDAIKKRTNKTLKVYGILLTRHSQKILLQNYAAGIADIAKEMKTKVFKAYIRECIAIREAQARRKSIFDYAPTSNGAEDYAAFTTEFIKTATKGGRNG